MSFPHLLSQGLRIISFLKGRVIGTSEYSVLQRCGTQDSSQMAEIRWAVVCGLPALTQIPMEGYMHILWVDQMSEDRCSKAAPQESLSNEGTLQQEALG